MAENTIAHTTPFNPSAPLRLPRCRSFSSASWHRTHAWQQRDRDRLSPLSKPVGIGYYFLLTKMGHIDGWVICCCLINKYPSPIFSYTTLQPFCHEYKTLRLIPNLRMTLSPLEVQMYRQHELSFCLLPYGQRNDFTLWQNLNIIEFLPGSTKLLAVPHKHLEKTQHIVAFLEQKLRMPLHEVYRQSFMLCCFYHSIGCFCRNYQIPAGCFY